MASRTTLIRPGLLVALRTVVRGGVRYTKTDLDPARTAAAGAEVTRWETVREIEDAAEHDRAVKARSLARSTITREVCQTSFGYLCPSSNEVELLAAVAVAQRIAADFNASAIHTRIDVNVITGRIADSDEQAMQAVAAEVRELLERMESGIREADPEAIRDACKRAKEVSGILSRDAQIKVGEAIEEARTAARTIVSRVQKAGEQASAVISEISVAAMESARFAVLDMADGDFEAVAVPEVGRAIEFEPEVIDVGAVLDARQAPPAIEFADFGSGY